MRRLAIVLVQAGLFFGVTGACSGNDENPPTPTRIMPGGRGGMDGGGTSGTGGDTAGGTNGGSQTTAGQGGVTDTGGAGGDPSVGGAGQGGAIDSGGAGGVIDGGGAGGVIDTGGAGGAIDTGGAGGAIDTGGAGGAGGSPSVQCLAAGTINVIPASSSDWSILGENDPTLTLCRGNVYTFAVNAPGHTFYIKTAPGSTAANAYDTGVTNNGASTGNVVFDVPVGAPDTLYYNCGVHAAMSGVLQIVD